MKIKAVIFDLDGSLYDNSTISREVVLHSLFHLRTLYAERVTRHHISGRYFGGKGATYNEIFRRMAAITGRSRDRMAAWYWNDFMPLQVKMLRKHHHVKPWVKDTIDYLHSRGVKVACFSEYSFVREKLKAIGLDPAVFDYLVDAPTAGGCKPCRKAFLYIAAKLDIHPADILMVGDREDTDGAGAESCNMQFLLVSKKDGPAPEIICD